MLEPQHRVPSPTLNPTEARPVQHMDKVAQRDILAHVAALVPVGRAGGRFRATPRGLWRNQIGV